MLFKDITVIGEDFTPQDHMNLITTGDKITYVGKELPQYEGALYTGINKVAVPGFFNSHCHVPMGLMRGYGENLPLDRWLHEKIFPFEALMPSDDMYWGSLLGIAELLACGAVSFTDMYMKMDGICKAVTQSGIKANLSQGATSFDPTKGFADTNDYKGMSYLLEFMKTASNDKIIGDASIHGEYTSHERLVREVGEFATEHKLRLHIHLSETKKEHEECKARHNGMTPTQWFDHCKAFRVPTTAAHCVWVEDDDIAILAKKHVTAVNCPSSNLKLGSGFAPVKKFLAAGVDVAIGTDGASSNNNLNMLEEINLSALSQKGINQDAAFLSPAQLLKHACQNGAFSQGRIDSGCIKAGNRADIAIFDFDKAHIQPVYDSCTALLYSAQGSDVCLTMVDGEVLYQNGEYKTIDIEQVKFNARRIRDEKLLKLSKV